MKWTSSVLNCLKYPSGAKNYTFPLILMKYCCLQQSVKVIYVVMKNERGIGPVYRKRAIKNIEKVLENKESMFAHKRVPQKQVKYIVPVNYRERS